MFSDVKYTLKVWGTYSHTCKALLLLLLIRTNIFPGGSEVKASAHNEGDPGSIPGLEDPLEKEMATHFNILA